MPSISIGGIEEDGKAIAKIEGGKDNGKIVYINQDSNKKSDNDEEKIISMLNEVIEEEVRNNAQDNRMRRRVNEMNILRQSFMEDKDELKDVRLNMIYQQIKRQYNDQVSKEYRCDQGDHCILKPIPNIETRECVYCAGPSGSGKSTYVREYAKAYNKLFPDHPIFLFSKVNDDPSLKGISKLKHIELDDEIVNEPITLEELKNSLCIFDDVSTISKKKVREAIFDLINDILEVGRHMSIYICVTNHLLSDYKNTRTILNECSSLTCFPTAGSSQQIKYVLKTYFGLDARDIQKILKLPSRWTTIGKSYPQYVMYQTGAYLL